MNSGYSQLLRFKQNKKWGFINQFGEVVVPAHFEELGLMSPEGAVASKKDGLFGVINESGGFTIDPQFEFVGARFSQGMLSARKHGKYGYINSEGLVEIDFRFSSAGLFLENAAPVVDESGSYFIDLRGGTICSLRYEQVRFFSEGLAAVISAGKLGFINKVGRLVVDQRYDTILSSNFFDGHAAVYAPDGWRLIDSSGVSVIEPSQILFVGDVSNHQAVVCAKSNSWSYFDLQDYNWSPRTYESASRFVSGRAIVGYDEKLWLINLDYELIKVLECERLISIGNGFAIVEINGLEGVIDLDGNWRIPCRYDKLELSAPDIFEFECIGRIGYVNMAGEEIWNALKDA